MPLRKTAYEFVLKKILSGDYKPGQKLSEPSLAKLCGVSRTPMHEAVRALIEEGVLTQRPKSGTYVAELNRGDVRDAFEIRLAIETSLLEKAMPLLTAAQLDRLDRTVAAMRSAIEDMRHRQMPIMSGAAERRFLENDVDFHLILLNASGNRLAARMVTNAYRRNQFFGTHSHQRNLSHVARAWRYHAEIARAVRRRDTSAAVRWLSQHILSSMRDALS